MEFENFCPDCDEQNQETGLVTRNKKTEKEEPCKNHVKIKFLDFYAQFPMSSLAKLTESYAYEVQQGLTTAADRFPVSYKGLVGMVLEGYLPFESFITKGHFPYLNWCFSQKGDELKFLSQTCFPSNGAWVAMKNP